MILRGQKLGNNPSKHINANVCKNDRTCACNRLSFYLLYVNGNAKTLLVFVVKWYAVRETEKWRYAVRKAKIGRYAVRQGGGGVTLMSNKACVTYGTVHKTRNPNLI